MKIPILLCVLATIVTGLPTSIHEREPSYNNLPVTITRDERSSHHDHAAGSSPEIAMEGNSKLLSKQSNTEGRSLGFKKPIIIKKKIGYHLYRDSDEEMAHADPHENCRKQVKVKLCDEEPGSPGNMAQCFVSESLKEGVSEREIENSIKTAKKAVENLQRGFHKMEHSSTKMANIDDKDLEDDFEVHRHIEAARKALEHVQQNFGNLETLNFQGIDTKNVQFQQKSSDEERLAQWKEAVDNIQRNFEIVKNIEDAFKVDSQKADLLSTEKSDILHTDLNVDSQQNSNIENLNNAKPMSDELDSLKQEREDSHNEMFTSSTEQKELPFKLHSDSLKSEIISIQEETPTTNQKTDEFMDSQGLQKVEPQDHGPEIKYIPMSDEPVNDHGHKHQSKTANDNNLEMLPHEQSKDFKPLERNSSTLNVISEDNALSVPEEANQTLKETSDLKSINEQITMTKSAHIEEQMGQKEHNMLLESNDVNVQKKLLEEKHILNSDRDKTVYKEKSLDETPILQLRQKINEYMEKRMESQNNNQKFHDGTLTSIQETGLNVPENKHRNTLNNFAITTSNHNEQPILNDDFNMRSIEEKYIIQLTPNKESGFNTRHENLNEHTITQVTENQSMEHKLDETHDLAIMRSTQHNKAKPEKKHHSDHFNLESTKAASEMQNIYDIPSKTMDTINRQNILNEQIMRTTQEQSRDHLLTESQRLLNPFSSRWADENQQRDDVSLTAPLEEHLMNEHMSLRLGQDPNTGHNFNEKHDLKQALFMKWAQEQQQNDLLQLAKMANGHNEHTRENGGFIHRQNLLEEHNMRNKQHQNMRNELPDDYLHDSFLMRLAQEKQQKDLFKIPSDIESEQLHEVLPENRFANNLANDFSQLGAKMQDHSHIMKHAMTSDIDSAMQPSVHMAMRETLGPSVMDHNDVHWNHHHHAMARYGTSLPISGVSPSTVGVFPNANTGCGIPLMLSCTPSVVSGNLAKAHPASIATPAFRSGDDLMFYMKRNANDMEELPAVKIKKTSLPFHHKTELIFDKTQ